MEQIIGMCQRTRFIILFSIHSHVSRGGAGGWVGLMMDKAPDARRPRGSAFDEHYQIWTIRGWICGRNNNNLRMEPKSL